MVSIQHNYSTFSTQSKPNQGSGPENRYRQKGGLKLLPSFKIQHNKYSKIVKWVVPRQEKYPALPGFPNQPAQNRPGPVGPAYLVHTAPTLHFFLRYSYIRQFFPKWRMLYLFYGRVGAEQTQLITRPPSFIFQFLTIFHVSVYPGFRFVHVFVQTCMYVFVSVNQGLYLSKTRELRFVHVTAH